MRRFHVDDRNDMPAVAAAWVSTRRCRTRLF